MRSMTWSWGNMSTVVDSFDGLLWGLNLFSWISAYAQLQSLFVSSTSTDIRTALVNSVTNTQPRRLAAWLRDRTVKVES